MNYAELHCHSAFSLLDGASLPEELIERARDVGLAALAITDHDDMGGAVRFAAAARESSFCAIIGAEISLEEEHHIILLARNLTGYKNICHLISKTRLNAVQRGLPRASIELLAEHSEGVVALSGCPLGHIPSLIARGHVEQARLMAGRFKEIYGDQFFLELWDHDLRQEAAICREMLELSRREQIPWVVTNNVHYAIPEKRIIHDVLVCLKHNVTLSTAGRRLRPNGNWYLKSPREIVWRWRNYPEGVKNTLLVAERCEFRLGTLRPALPEIDAQRLRPREPFNVDIPASLVAACGGHASYTVHPTDASHVHDTVHPTDAAHVRDTVHPTDASHVRDTVHPTDASPVHDAVHPTDAAHVRDTVHPTDTAYVHDATRPPNQTCPPSATNPPAVRAVELRVATAERNRILCELVWHGAQERYGDRLSDHHIKQLQHELSLITRLDLAPYFLIMRDIISFAEEQDIAVQGRGSAANSAVCYCLKITAVDPIGMELLFERFISEERNEPPDIDLDIAHKDREHVLQYVYEKYGRDHAAMVCEHISYRGRSAVRDAARIFDFSPEQGDKLAAQVHYREAGDAAEALKNGGAEAAGLDARDRKVKLLIRVVAGLHQLPRHRSIHVGGFVLSGEPIGRIVPVEPASMPGRTVIQWDKDDIDLAGLIKIDLLGLGILTMIHQGIKLVQQHRKIDIDLSQLDMCDPQIYEMLQKADTIGVFQVESRAQMSILPKIRPSCFYDIVVSIAIVRPGPIQGNIVHPYLRRRRGLEAVSYVHPSVEPILKRTLGVPLFQEQGMRLAVVAAGFTASEADQLRRVMSHKRSLEKMAKLCEQLAEGMRKNDFSEEAIETITFQLKAFANYGFPESHAASFALLVFASAYIKRYYAPEFFCAILNAQPMGFYSPATLVRDAIRHNVDVRPVDLSCSSWDCTLEPADGAPALRIGLRYVDGLGASAKRALELAWSKGGVFRSLEDVCRRSGLGAKDLENLAAAGAFESFCPGRRKAVWAVLKTVKNKREQPLLDLLSANARGSSVPAMSQLEETIADYRRTGLSIGPHPMCYYRAWAGKRGMLSCRDLGLCEPDEIIRIAASVICRQQPNTAKGFVFLTIEDEFGTGNVIINPKVFERYRDVIIRNNFLSIRGRLQKEENVLNIIADSFGTLPGFGSLDQVPITSRDFH